MRHQWDDLSGSFLAPSEPDPALDCSVLLIVAGRMQGESLRYHLVSRGFEVDLARSVSAARARLNGVSYDALVLDWQTLEVEFPGPSGVETWVRLIKEVGTAVGLVALLEADQFAPAEIEQAGAIRISRGAASEPHALAAAVERAIERQAAAPPAAAPDPLPSIPTVAAASGVIEHFLFGESEAIRRVFMLALCRAPSDAEFARFRKLMAEDLQASRREVLEDLCWSVLTGREFLFNR